MGSVTLKDAVISKFKLEENEFEKFFLKRTLFFRARLIRPVVSLLNRNFLFNEKRLVQQLAKTVSMREVHDEIDFYQHKFVAGFLVKEALMIRISGLKVYRLANEAFQASVNKTKKDH